MISHVKITGNFNIPGHCIPVGSVVMVLSITDDEIKVWDGFRFHWIGDDDYETIEI